MNDVSMTTLASNLEERLDNALELTFPASDALAVTPDRVVVAATDFTPAALAAARRAAALARASGARLVLLHAGSEQARERLRLSGARLGLSFGLPVETRLVPRPAPSAIAAYARDSRADLIVVGNREASFLTDLLALNTADRVRRRTAIPVLAVSRASSRAYRRVLVATDLSESSAQAGRVAARLFPEAEMHALHVREPLYQSSLHFAGVDSGVIASYRRRALSLASRELEDFVRQSLPAGAVRPQVRLGPPATRIREHARELAADVVVLSPGKSWLARAMSGRVTEQVLADPPCDVLLAGGPERGSPA
jgi:nucleotide-binding universal stress UspA family protein